MTKPVSSSQLQSLLRPFSSVPATSGQLTFTNVNSGSFDFYFDVGNVTLQYKTVHAEGFFTCPPTA